MSVFLYVTSDILLQCEQSLISTCCDAFVAVSAALSRADLLQESSTYTKLKFMVIISPSLLVMQLQRTPTLPYRE